VVIGGKGERSKWENGGKGKRGKEKKKREENEEIL